MTLRLVNTDASTTRSYSRNIGGCFLTRNIAMLEVMAEVKTIDLNFPKWVFKGIESVHQPSLDEDNVYGRKYFVLNLAFAQFNDHKLGKEAAQKAYTLSDTDSKTYQVVGGQSPGYFKRTFDKGKISKPNVTLHKEEYYDYDSSKDGGETMVFWLDFANSKLGGGVFGDGFLQEERMCCETPDLANAADFPSRPIETRKGGADVLKGSPTPVAITGVHRVIDTTGNSPPAKKIDDLRNTPPTLMDLYWKPTDWIARIQPVKFNVLAMAAPELPSEPKHPPLQNTPPLQNIFQDLFNTFMAGFHLAWAVNLNTEKKQRVAINTGPIGCGQTGFKNNKWAVWVLQVLAASQKDVKLHFWGYAEDDWDDVFGICGHFPDNPTIDDLLDYASKYKWEKW